jgi:KaiC/GvpD/RAD55 family RecA-like ATPase
MVKKKSRRKTASRRKVIEKKPRREVGGVREIAELKLIPTGISSLDSAIGGGFPEGSLVLSTGEIGTGYDQFVMTSSVMLTAMKTGRISHPSEKNIILPEETWWVTFNRPESDLMNEFSRTFDSDLYESFREQVKFKDLSKDYFATSSVPLEWVSETLVQKRQEEMIATLGKALSGAYRLSEKPSTKPKGLLNSLADFLTKLGPNNFVVLHSLTDLAILYSDSDERWYDFMIFLRGLQRVTKKWGGIIHTSLDANLLDKHKEEEIAACVDGVMSFEWAQAGPVERRRTLYIKKFRRLPAAEGGIMRFDVNVSSSVGLQVIKPELIVGLKA